MNYTKTVLLALLLTCILPVGSSQSIPLNGNWKFALDPDLKGLDEQWFQQEMKEEVRLPGSNVENRKGFDPTLDTRFTASIYDSSWYLNPHMEKYRQPENFKMPFWLTQLKYFTGYAWYQREITIPANWKGNRVQLFLERPHFITHIWIDNREVGRYVSHNTPHSYDLTAFVEAGKSYQLTLCVNNRLKDMDVGTNSHSVTDHTQGNWNGVVGRMELQLKQPVHTDEVQVYPDLAHQQALVKLTIANPQLLNTKGSVVLKATSFNSTKSHRFSASLDFELTATDSTKQLELPLLLGDKMQTWDEFDPALYRLTAYLTTPAGVDTMETQFGMREISIEGKWIYINGRKTLMRGTVENALFPLTGYPPMDVASWERVFRICKTYGLNHMRFHSYGPPEAAFKAADLVGIYLQPEGPAWPNHSTQLGRGYPIDTYLLEETKRMVKHYGNYASFVMMAAGNEPRGNWVSWVGKFVDYWKKADPRRIYTGASVGGSWAWQPKSQYHVKAGARGLDWSRNRPESNSDYRQWIDTVSQPFISHETGQWCVFPDFEEIKKYTGVTRAKNFELFQELLGDQDMGQLSREFLHASGKLQVVCYKHEIEKTLRTPDYAGFQLLSLNDFSGQGTALVGLLNAFWEEKGYVTAPEFRRFCSPTVPLIRTGKFVYRNNERLQASVELSHFDALPLEDVRLQMTLRRKDGRVVHEQQLTRMDVPIGSNIPAGTIDLDLSAFTAPVQLNLEIRIEGTGVINDWNFWVYPAVQELPAEDDIYIVRGELDDKARKLLSKGGKVLLMTAGKVSYGKDVVQYYQPAFWNTSWFKMRPPHTTGVLIRNEHPLFKDFITDNWADMQWWELLNKAQTMQLDDFPKGFQPVVQPIDTWFISRKLGMLFEAKVGKGKLLMTSFDLESNPEERPVARALYQSVLRYMHSGDFNPGQVVPLKAVTGIFTKKAEPYNFYSRTSPDELKQGKI